MEFVQGSSDPFPHSPGDEVILEYYHPAPQPPTSGFVVQIASVMQVSKLLVVIVQTKASNAAFRYFFEYVTIRRAGLDLHTSSDRAWRAIC